MYSIIFNRTTNTNINYYGGMLYNETILFTWWAEEPTCLVLYSIEGGDQVSSPHNDVKIKIHTFK